MCACVWLGEVLCVHARETGERAADSLQGESTRLRFSLLTRHMMGIDTVCFLCGFSHFDIQIKCLHCDCSSLPSNTG